VEKRFAIASLLMLVGLTAAGVTVRNAWAAQTAPASQPAPTAQAPRPTPPCGPNLVAEVKNVTKDSRCFELRTYTVREGSSMDLLHKRFREHSTKLFAKHHMPLVGFWQAVAKPDTLVYLLAFKDAAERDARWAEFQADPEWKRVASEMRVSLQVDQLFLSATDYSPMK
jgi:hypothetical protein